MTERRPFAGGYRSQRHEAPASFEDKLNRFLKDSDERLLDLKRNVESNRAVAAAAILTEHERRCNEQVMSPFMLF